MCAHMCICVCAYTCTYVSAILIHGELNLGWVRIFPIEHDRKTELVRMIAKAWLQWKNPEWKLGEEGSVIRGREMDVKINELSALVGSKM